MENPKIEIHHVKDWSPQSFVLDANRICRGWPFGCPVIVKTPTKICVTTATDVEPPNGLGSGAYGWGLSYGRVWLGRCATLKMEHTSCSQYLFRPIHEHGGRALNRIKESRWLFIPVG